MITVDIETHGRPVIEADSLRTLILEGEDVTLVGLRIVDRLDLRGVNVLGGLRIVECEFEDEIDLCDARAERPLEWIGGKLSRLVADRLQSRASVSVTHVSVSGPISLHWAIFNGDLRFTESTFHVPGAVAIDGTDVRVDGGLFLDGPLFHAEGEVNLSGAHVKQSLDCRHARFENPSGCSIRAFELVVDGDVLFEDRFDAVGEVCLERARIGRLRASGGRMRRGGSNESYALRGDALRARSGVFLDRGFEAIGKVRLVGADLDGELCCTGGTFETPEGTALDARRLHAEDVYLDHGFDAKGEVRLDGALLVRQLNCTGGSFVNEKGYALDADDMQCDGDVFLNSGFLAKGEVRLVGAQIRNELNCTGGHFQNQGGIAINADGFTTPGNAFLDSRTDRQFTALGEVRLARATVGRQLVLSGAAITVNANSLALDLSGLACSGDVRLDGGFRSTGEVRMRGADISRDLTFQGGDLQGDHMALDAKGLKVGGALSWHVAETPGGIVDLSFATVSQFDDSLTKWPEHYVLAGFKCRTPAGSHLTVDHWKEWLKNADSHYDDAYQQMSATYRANGDEAFAREINIVRQQDLRKRGGLGLGAKLWNWFLDKTTGYGYKFHRLFFFLLAWAAAGTLVFALASDLMVKVNPAREVPPFQPFVYSVQLLLPVVDFQETQVWLPDKGPWWGALMTYIWITITIGWIASVALVAGIGRLFRQRD